MSKSPPKNIHFNPLIVFNIARFDAHEALVTFKAESGNEITAYIGDEALVVNEKYAVQFDCLEDPLAWKAMLAGNSAHKKALEPTGTAAAYAAFGQIVSVDPVIADFGDIVMELGDITEDAADVGAFIRFNIERLFVLDFAVVSKGHGEK